MLSWVDKLVKNSIAAVVIKGVIICIAIMTVIFILDSVYDHYKKKKEKKQNEQPVEALIPESFLRMTVHCQSCGASVPLKTDGKLTMQCPFCSAQLEISRQLVDQATQLSREKANNAILAQQLENQRKEHELEEQRIQEKRSRDTKNLIMIIIPIALVIAVFALMVMSRH